jgi:hypothetical protein
MCTLRGTVGHMLLLVCCRCMIAAAACRIGEVQRLQQRVQQSCLLWLWRVRAPAAESRNVRQAGTPMQGILAAAVCMCCCAALHGHHASSVMTCKVPVMTVTLLCSMSRHPPQPLAAVCWCTRARGSRPASRRLGYRVCLASSTVADVAFQRSH